MSWDHCHGWEDLFLKGSGDKINQIKKKNGKIKRIRLEIKGMGSSPDLRPTSWLHWKSARHSELKNFYTIIYHIIYRGILVKLVIRISSGHPKIKIISFVKYATFAWFLLCNNVLWLKNWFGNLIPHLANILWPVFGNSLSRGDTEKNIQRIWPGKVFFLHR